MTRFCINHKNVEALQALKSMKAIQVQFLDGSNTPVYAYPLDAAGIVWVENSEKWKDRIWGFTFGVASTLLAEFIIRMLTV